MPETIRKEKLADPSRRRFFSGKVKAKQNLRLPWVINESVFTSGCTQCESCINSCETNIIVKDEDGYPKIDFNLGECTFCNKCISACDQPLFSGSFSDSSANNNTDNIISAHKAWPVLITISDKCLAKNNIYCQSCRDECETSVIKFNYTTSSIPEPQINDNDCTQCGACIKSCPQDAITFVFESSATTLAKEPL